MIDYNVFDMTYSDFGAEMINEIIDIYISEHESRFITLKENIDSGDLDPMGKNAHSLKGATSVLYDTDVAELARQMEFKGKKNDSSGINDLYDNLHKEANRLIEDLKQLKKKYPI